MQVEVIKKEAPLISVSNYEQQSVEALISPNLMFINRPVEVAGKKYYKLIIWFDYKSLKSTISFNKDLLLKEFKFQLQLKRHNQLINLGTKEYETKPTLKLSYDEQQFRIMDQKNDYLTYLIEEEYISQNLELVYNLNFLTANYQQFLNQDGKGVNRGKIKIQTTFDSNDQKVVIPEIFAYLANDNYNNTTNNNYLLLTKTYQLEKMILNYVNLTPPLIFKVSLSVHQEIPLVILNQTYLKEIIYDLVNNLVNDDLVINNVSFNADEKLDDYYQNQVLSYQVKKVSNGVEVYLTSKWNYDFDSHKIINNDQGLVFNPFVKGKQWIAIDFSLSNKIFQTKVFLSQIKPEIVLQARNLDYQLGLEFKTDLKNNQLTYLDYLQVINEN